MRNTNTLRRLMAVALAIVMTMALAIPAFAAEPENTGPDLEAIAAMYADWDGSYELPDLNELSEEDQEAVKAMVDAIMISREAETQAVTGEDADLTGDEVPAVTGFSDVPPGHTFYAGVMDCASKGITNGYDDGTFRPANTVTRAQFCVMLSRGFYSAQVAAQNTEKNKAIAWFAPNTIALKNAGILKSTAFENYATNASIMNQNVTRYDMAQLMVNIMSAKGYKATTAQKTAAQAKIKDYKDIPAKYQDAVKTVYALGIITGYPNGTFGGWNNMNRGQGCIVIYRMMKYTPATSTKPSTGDTTYDDGKTETPVTPKPETPTTHVTKPETPTTPETKPETPAGKTLTNGKPVSEANVKALLNELRTKYPTETTFTGYRTPSAAVNKVASSYTRAKGGTTSTTDGCGGWAAMVSDYIFGTNGFPARKVSIQNARPGDIAITLNNDGKLTHVSIITVNPWHDSENEWWEFKTCDANFSGANRIAWDNRGVQYDDGYGYKREVWTRYPD